MTVLVVDNEKDVRHLIDVILSAAGYKVYTAVNGEEALRICCDGHPGIDLLITDVIMPEVDGKNIKVRSDSHNVRIPVLCMSAYSANAMSRGDEWDGRPDFVAKPFRPSDLLHKVEEVLRSSHAAATGRNHAS